MAAQQNKLHIENSQKRIRVLFGGEFIVDTTKAKLVWEKPSYPTFFFVEGDVPSEYLQHSRALPDQAASVYNVIVGDKVARDAAIGYESGDLLGHIKIIFSSMDAWFEEDEEVFVHPKDPYKRVDVLQSSRHIRVEVDGVVVAETHQPHLLFETGLRVRTYIPKTDCRLNLLKPSSLRTSCPYKGEASYYSVVLPSGKTAENVVWWYPTPLVECSAIKGLLAFYDEKVDVWVDGVEQPK